MKTLFLLLNTVALFTTICSQENVSNSSTEIDKNGTLITSKNINFSPKVSATCRTGVMTIKVETKHNFAGVVHSRDYRKPECSGFGENSKITFLRINMLAEKRDEDYCGIFYSQPNSEERSVAVAVRTHKTLELVDDKFYMITCGKAGFQNSRNQTSVVNLQLMRNDEKVEKVVYGNPYVLRADISHPDGQFGMKVKRCFSFSDTNNTVQLVDNRGCPDPNIITPFRYNRSFGYAEADILSMFKFPESNRVHFQCDVIICKDQCKDSLCNVDFGQSGLNDPGSLPPANQDENAMMASYSVFVLDPGTISEPLELPHILSNSSPAWVLYLCIVFGVLFLIMLIVNVFLCSAMTCTCARSSVIEYEGEGGRKDQQSMIEEFDPYTRSWHGSQYGSRYSLSGGIKPIPPPLISVDTSHSISSSDYETNNGGTNLFGNHATSMANNGSANGMPAVYGVPVHSRPSSRYSNRSHRSRRSRSKPHPNHNSSYSLDHHTANVHSSSSAISAPNHHQYSKYSNGRIIVS